MIKTLQIPNNATQFSYGGTFVSWYLKALHNPVGEFHENAITYRKCNILCCYAIPFFIKWNKIVNYKVMNCIFYMLCTYLSLKTVCTCSVECFHCLENGVIHYFDILSLFQFSNCWVHRTILKKKKLNSMYFVHVVGIWASNSWLLKLLIQSFSVELSLSVFALEIPIYKSTFDWQKQMFNNGFVNIHVDPTQNWFFVRILSLFKHYVSKTIKTDWNDCGPIKIENKTLNKQYQ